MRFDWDEGYPSKEVLRREVKCLTDVFTEVFLETMGADAIEGIYFKGSAQKAWDSPVDYVPEISDVDLHVLFADEAAVGTHLGTAEQALAVCAEVERRFEAKTPMPVHHPRPQLIVLNHLEVQDDYLGPAEGTVTTLHGAAPHWGDYTDTERLRDIARRQLLELTEYSQRFPLRAVDKPARYVWELLRHIVWNVSPVAPKVLILRGVPPEDAWRINRTALLPRLCEVGEEALAEAYAGFYLNGWKYFLSNRADTDAGRAALFCGTEVIRRGIEIAR